MGTEGKEVLYIREEGKDQSAISSIEYQGVGLSTLAYLHSKAPGTKKQASSPLTGNSILRKPLHTEIKSIAITATRSLRYAYPDLVIPNPNAALMHPSLPIQPMVCPKRLKPNPHTPSGCLQRAVNISRRDHGLVSIRVLAVLCIESQLELVRQVLLLGPGRSFRPGPHLDQFPNGSLTSTSLAQEDGLVHLGRSVLAEVGVDQLLQLWRKRIVREEQQSHRLLERLQKFTVCGGAGSKLVGCKLQGRVDISAVAFPDQLNQLQAQELKVQRRVLFENLFPIMSAIRLQWCLNMIKSGGVASYKKWLFLIQAEASEWCMIKLEV